MLQSPIVHRAGRVARAARVVLVTTSAGAALLLAGCQGPPAPPSEYVRLFDEAEEAIQLKNFVEARTKLREIIERYPDQEAHLENLRLLASCEHELDQYDAAIELWNEVLRKSTESSRRAEDYERLGMSQHKAEQYAAAAESFAQAYELAGDADPTVRARYLRSRGIALQRAGRFDEAHRVFRQVIELAPGSEPAVLAGRRLELPNYFTVQVGAYSQRRNAETLVEKLRASAFPAEVVASQRTGAVRYYVYVGRFSSRQNAVNLRARLLASNALERATELFVVP